MLLTKNFALSPSHYFFSSIAIFLQDQTSLAMQHIILLKMPSARVADMSGSVADLARSNSKRKKADFGKDLTFASARKISTRVASGFSSYRSLRMRRCP